MRRLLACLLAAAAAFASSGAASAQSSLFCKFDRLCSSSGCSDSDYFVELRMDDDAAFFNDGARIAEAETFTGRDWVSFLETDDAGNLSLTTVYQDLSAALSAHGIGPEGPSSVLRLGACQEDHG